MDNSDITTYKKSKFNNILYTILFVVLPGCVLYTYMDYNTYGFGRYVIIDIVNFIAIVLIFIVYKFGLISKVNLMIGTVYSLIFSLGITLIASTTDSTFNFESFYITAQMLFVLLIFAIGLFVHFESILVIVVFDIIFSITSYFSSGQFFPIEKYLFHTLVVCGAGIMAYVGQKAVMRLYKKIKTANVLVNVQNQELLAINQSKDELFKIIGHDLKTPFHQLTGLVDLLLEEDDEQQKNKIQSYIKETSVKGTDLLDDLLQWGQNPKLHTNIILKEQSLDTILNNVLNFSLIPSQKKDIQIVNTIPSSFRVVANTLMLETILRNIITNAIKFSHRKSKIIIKSTHKKNTKLIIVEDHGVGIKKRDLKTLFDTSKVKAQSGTENEKGNGFGLNIAKKLMEKQKGELIIKSEFQLGTSMILKFPTNG